MVVVVWTFPSGPLATNAIFLGCFKSKKGAVFDPSLGSAEPILQKTREEGFSIEKILLTHSHWDHFADAYLLKTETKAPVCVHSADAKNLEEPGSDGLPLFFEIHPVQPDHLLKEGEVVEVGMLRLKVIHTPGHSPGSICFYLEAEKLLFSGDTLFHGGIGNLQLATAEPQRMGPSLQKLASLPPDTRVIPGHGEETTIGEESFLTKR